MHGFCFKFGGMDDVSDRIGRQNVRSLDHWAWSQCLRAIGCGFFGKREIQSRIATHGTIFKLK